MVMMLSTGKGLHRVRVVDLTEMHQTFDETWIKLIETEPEQRFGLPAYSVFNKLRNDIAKQKNVGESTKDGKEVSIHIGIPPLAKFIWRYSIACIAHKNDGEAGVFSGRTVAISNKWLRENATQKDVEDYKKYCMENVDGRKDRTGFINLVDIL